MLRWAAIFFVIAMIVGALGFSAAGSGATDIARILFMIFLALFITAAVIHTLKSEKPLV